MKRKYLAATLALTLIMSAFAGCGAGSGNTDSGSTETSGTTSQSTDSSASETDASGEAVTLQMMAWNPDIELLDEAHAEWVKVNPNITVEFSRVDYTDHIQNLKIKMASGEGPDIFTVQTGSYMVEFNEFTQDIAPLAEAKWGADWKNMWIPYTLEHIQGSLDSVYGLPLGTGYAGQIWADKFYFDKYDLALPTNYDELLAVSKSLRENGEYPLVIGAKDDWVNIDMWMSICNDINPSKLYGAIAGESSFTDPDMIEALRIWQSLFTTGIFQDGALGVNVYNDTADGWNKEGPYPMFCVGGWNINSYKTADEVRYAFWNDDNGHAHDVFTIDWNMDGKIAPVTANVDATVCLNKNSENLDAAWEFASWFVDKGQDIFVNNYLQYFPSKAGAVFEGEISDEGRANLEKLMDMGENNVGGYREMAYPELKQVICDQLKALGTGEATPEAAAEIIQAASEIQER